LSVWNDPKLTWFDPCAGKGEFLKRVYVRLMNNLQFFEDPIDRKRHILTNMLFMNEINRENEVDLQSFFGKHANIFFEDFLTFPIEFDPPSQNRVCPSLRLSPPVFSPVKPINQFDIILANPPYQTTKQTIYKGSVGNRTLWDKFLLKCFTLNNDNGFIGFITPANWRRPEHKLYRQITIEHNLIYLHIYGKNDGLSFFNAQTRFDLYLIQNIKRTIVPPLIIDEQNIRHYTIDLLSWPFLPNFSYEKFKPFISTTPSNSVIYDSCFYDARKLSKTKNDIFKHPIIHTLTKKGIGIRFSKTQNQHFVSPKVILNVNEKQYPVNDFDCYYGMTQLSFGIKINSFLEGEYIINIINSPLFKELLSATKWSSFQTDYRMFKYLHLHPRSLL
jgi:hypothetical protein